jgi:hypothetical protein
VRGPDDQSGEPSGVLDSRPRRRGLNRLVRTGWGRDGGSGHGTAGADGTGGGPRARLRVELIPKTSWYADVRELMDEAAWERISREVLDRAGGGCEICGARDPRQPMECHGVWRLEDRVRVQRLVRLIALCPDCHHVENMGFANMHGGGTRARAHLARVNGWTLVQSDAHVAEAFRVWARRSQGPWVIDVEGLRPYFPAAEYARIAHQAATPPRRR